jgi:carbon-monoxide dehydrogenase large subunit
MEPGLSDEAFFEPTNNTYPFGCCISMVEIDRETGEPKLCRLVAVDDAGNLINPLIVEGRFTAARAGNRPGSDRGGRLQRGRPAR